MNRLPSLPVLSLLVSTCARGARRRSRGRGAARLLSIAMVALLLMPSVSAAGTSRARAQGTPEAGPPDNGLTYEEASQRLDRLITSAERVRGQLDRRQLELGALSADLGVDPAAIVGYVVGRIAFEPYPGVLRGPEGTLLSRAGNAYDTALLTAALLAAAGFEVEVQRGTLSAAQAEELIRQTAAPRAAAEPIGNVDAIVALLRQIGRTAGMPDDELQPLIDAVVSPADPTDDPAYAAAADDAATLEATLADAGVDLGDPNLTAALAAEARDYAWVRYRKDAEQPWVEAHPAFKEDGAAPEGLAAAGSFTLEEGIPPELLHRVRVAVTLERNLGGTLETRPITAPVDEAAMDLALRPLTLSIQSNAIYALPDPADAGEVIGATDLFLATIGQAAPGAESTAFGLDGALYQLSQIEGGAFGVTPQPGEVIADSLNDAADALDAMGGDDGSGEEAGTPAPVASVLTAVWVDYTLVAPGGAETTVRRTVVDRIGPAGRAAGAVDPADPDDREVVTTSLLRQTTMMVATGAVPQLHATDAALAYLVATGPAYRAALREAYFPDEAVTAGTIDVAPGFPGLLPMLAAFDGPAEADPTTVAYRAAPTIVTYRESTRRDPTAADRWVVATAIDVVGNARRVLSVDGGTVAPAAEAALLQGVWETHAEEAANPNPYELPQANTMAALAAAAEAGAAVAVVSDEAGLAGLDLAPDVLATMRVDLDRGFVVVVPEATTDPGGRTGWWRVNPRTGETLGMTSDGGGQSMAEYSLLFSVLCAGYAGFAGWGALTTLANCGGLIGGYALGVAGASALVGLVFGAIFLVIGNELGDRKL